METLNYKVLAETGYNGYILKDAPVKVMQFGEGNFLRAFVDYFYDIANEKAGYNGKVKLVQPIGNFPQMADWINEQEGLYTLYLRGSEKGQKVDAKRVISCVSDCVCPYVDGKWDEVLALARSEELETVVSNTTEAGIAYTQGDSAFDQVPPNSFPAKLTRVLYERYKAFNGAADKGLVILSCELIDNNGKELQKCCNNYAKDWNLDAAFIDWMNNANTFCSTLVDRIVPGRIRDPKELAALEEANGARLGLLLAPAPIQAVWLGKALAGLLLLLVAQMFFLPAAVVFLSQEIGALWPVGLGTLLLVDVGMCALGSLLGALSQGGAARESLLSIVLFPLLVPLLLAGIGVAAQVFGAPAPDGPASWIGLAAAFDGVFLAAGLLLFGFMYSGDE